MKDRRFTTKSRVAFLFLLAAVAVIGFFLRPRVVYEPWETTELPAAEAVDERPVLPVSFAEVLGGGIAVLDFDGDGRQDLLVSRSGPRGGPGERRGGVALYRNLEERGFAEATAAAGLEAPGWCFGIGAGDFNGDGHDDFYLARSGKDRLYINEGGRFRNAAGEWGVEQDGLWGTSVAVADFDRDGRLDVAVACWNRSPPRRKQGAQALTAPALLYLQRSPGRFERRGLPLPADGGGEKTYRSIYRSLGAAAADINRDGFFDILLSSYLQEHRILFGDGAGNFDPGPAGEEEAQEADGALPIAGIDWGDLTGDGRPEIVATRAREVKRADRRGPLDPRGELDVEAGRTVARAARGWGLQMFDADNDGDLDIFVAGGGLEAGAGAGDEVYSYSGHCLFYLNSGGGHFREVGKYFGDGFREARLHRGAACADFDGDGRLDVAVARLDGPPVVLWNRLERRRWLRLRLEPDGRAASPRSPPGGIGARVELEAGGRRQVRWAQRSGGYLSSRELTLHFGLGELERADRLRIRWPSGQVDEHGPLAANRVYRAVEGGEMSIQDSR